MKIERYKTVFAQKFEDLDRLVKMEIDQGFQPYWSPYVRESQVEGLEGNSFICQAMIRERTMS